MKFILASSSPRRKKLFKFISDKFDIVVPQVEEIVPTGISVNEAPIYLSEIKASAVAELHPEDIVIGADTAVIFDNTVLGKPRDAADAFRTLKLLSGNTHCVITGCTVICGKEKISFSRKTDVEFFELSDEEINSYIDTGEPFDKSGAYGIQGCGALLVKQISGDYFNVVGLPVADLKRNIEEIKQLIKATSYKDI